MEWRGCFRVIGDPAVVPTRIRTGVGASSVEQGGVRQRARQRGKKQAVDSNPMHPGAKEGPADASSDQIPGHEPSTICATVPLSLSESGASDQMARDVCFQIG